MSSALARVGREASATKQLYRPVTVRQVRRADRRARAPIPAQATRSTLPPP